MGDEPACFLPHSVSEFSEGTLENFEKFEISSLHRPRYVPPAPPRNFYKSRIFSDLYKTIDKIYGGGVHPFLGPTPPPPFFWGPPPPPQKKKKKKKKKKK